MMREWTTPASAWSGIMAAILLTVLILIECGVLAVNRGRCPLTDVAAKFTDKRADNFDIYLPNWLVLGFLA